MTTPYFTPAPLQGHLGSLEFCPHRINATMSIYLPGRMFTQKWDCWVRGSALTFWVRFGVSRERVLTPARGQTLSSFFSLSGNICLKLNLCSAGCLFVARLSLSLPPWAMALSVADTGKRKELFEQGVTIPANTQPPSFKSDNETRAKPESQALLARQELQGKHRGSRREGELWRGQWTCLVTRNLLSSELLSEALPGTWHHSPGSTRTDKVTLLSGTGSRLSLGAWPWGLGRGQPGSGYYSTTSLDLGPLWGVFLLTFHRTVRKQTFEVAGSHFRARLLTGEDERTYLAALGILFSHLFPATMACCHFHSAYWVAVLN